MLGAGNGTFSANRNALNIADPPLRDTELVPANGWLVLRGNNIVRYLSIPFFGDYGFVDEYGFLGAEGFFGDYKFFRRVWVFRRVRVSR